MNRKIEEPEHNAPSRIAPQIRCEVEQQKGMETMAKPHAIIVGAGRGVGMGVARAFTKEGFNLSLLSRNPEKLGDDVLSLVQQGASADSFAANAEDHESLSKAIGKANQKFGEAEVLIFNVLAFSQGKPSSISPASFTRDFHANVGAALACAQAVLPTMLRRKSGTIFFTGGGWALYPDVNFTSVSIDKSALRTLAFMLRVAVSDQVATLGKQFASTEGKIAGCLTYPVIGRVASDASDVHLPAADMNKKQAVIRYQSKSDPDFGGKKVGGQQATDVRSDEVGTAGFVFPERAGSRPCSFENVFDGLMADDKIEGWQRTGDSAIAPSRILPSHAEGQMYNRRIRWRSSSCLRFSRSGRVKLRGDQFAVPTQDGVGRDNAGDGVERFSAKFLTDGGERDSPFCPER